MLTLPVGGLALAAWALWATLAILPTAIAIAVWVLLIAFGMPFLVKRFGWTAGGFSQEAWKHRQVHRLRGATERRRYVRRGQASAALGEFASSSEQAEYVERSMKQFERVFPVLMLTLLLGLLAALVWALWVALTLLPTMAAIASVAALISVAAWQHLRHRPTDSAGVDSPGRP